MSQYPTKTEVAATYATKAELAAAVLGGTADLSAYSTTVQIAAIYATKTELADRYTKAEVDAIVAGINAGTVDLSGYATSVALTEAVQDLTAQIVARYTKDEVDGFFAALPPGAITVHDEELPAIGTTPQAAVESLRPYAQGCHWFARSRGLMLLNRDPVLGGEQVVLTAITPGQCVEGKIVAYVPPNGTTNAPASVLTVTGGGRVTRMEAAALTDEFALKGSGDVVAAVTQQQLAAAIAGVQTETLTPEQIQSIVDAVVANGFDLSAYYTAVETDAKLAGKADQTDFASFQGYVGSLEAANDEKFRLIGIGFESVAQQATVDAAVKELALDIQAVNDQTAATFQLFSDGLTPKFDAKADKTDVYTKTETDAAIANAATGGTVDLSDYARKTGDATNYFAVRNGMASNQAVNRGQLDNVEAMATNAIAGIVAVQTLAENAAPKSSVYTKTESDSRYVETAALTAELIVASIAGQDVNVNSLTLDSQQVTFGDGAAIASSNGRLVFAADASNPGTLEEVAFKSDGFAKLEDESQSITAQEFRVAGGPFGAVVFGGTERLSVAGNDLLWSGQPLLNAGSADPIYAKISNPEQTITAKVVAAQVVKAPFLYFDDARGFVIEDTGEGYGERLQFVTGLVRDPVVLKSDLDPLFPRMKALEDRAASVAPTPGVDTAAAVTLDVYTKAECDAKFLTLVDLGVVMQKGEGYTKADADAQFWRRDISDSRYMLKDEGMSKIDFNNQMVLFLYSRSQIDAKLAAISPMGATSINDPALAEIKASIIAEVKKTITGGVDVAPDVPWTAITRVAGTGTMEARLLNGVIYLRGDVTINVSATGSMTAIARLPASFPKPSMETNSITFAVQAGSTYRRGIVRISTDGGVAVCADGTMTGISLWGASAPTF